MNCLLSYQEYQAMHSCAGNPIESYYLREHIMQPLFEKYIDEEEYCSVLDELVHTEFTFSPHEEFDKEKYTLFFRYQSTKEELDLYLYFIAYIGKKPLMFLLERGEKEGHVLYLVKPQSEEYRLKRYIQIIHWDNGDGTFEYDFLSEELRNYSFPLKLVCNRVEPVPFEVSPEYFIGYVKDCIEKHRKSLLTPCPRLECIYDCDANEYFHYLSTIYNDIETVVEIDNCKKWTEKPDVSFSVANEDGVILSYERIADTQEVRLVKDNRPRIDRVIKIPEQIVYEGTVYTVTQIGEQAFEENVCLEEVVVPETVNVIGGAAFFDCLRLRKVQLPKHIERMEALVFSHCYSLETLELPEGVETAVGVVSTCPNLKEIVLPSSFTQAGYEHLTYSYWKDGGYPFDVK